MFFKIALLNIRRNLKRSLLIIFAVFISVVIMEAAAGMMGGMKKNFFDTLIGAEGHLQIHKKGYEERLNPYSIDYRIKNPNKVLEKVKSYPEVTTAEKITHFGAMLINEEKNLNIGGKGVNPETDYFEKVQNNMLKGSFLPDGKGIAVSAAIADLLNVEYGDDLVALVEDSQESPYYLSFPITGVFKTGSSEMDENMFFISHSNAENLLYIEDESVEVRINLTDPYHSQAFLEKIIPFLQENNLNGETWREIHGSMIVMVEMMDFFAYIINIFIIVVVATVITNAILMTVFERLQQYGTLRSIGLKKHQLFQLVVTEGSLLGLIGSVLGLAVGLPIVLYFTKYGLDIGAFAEVMGGTGSTYYFAVRPYHSLVNLGSGILIAVLGSSYAAMVSAKKSLVEALGQR